MSAISSRLQQALAVHQQGRLAEAESLYLALLHDHSAVFDGWHLYGALKLQQGAFAEAVDLIGKAIQLNNRSAQAFSNLGTALLNLQRYQEALEAYQNAVRVQPDYAAGHFNLGSLLATLQRTEEALESFDKTIASDAQHTSALQNRGMIYLGQKKYPQAIADFNQILAFNPDHIDSLLNRGLAYYQSGQFLEAIHNYDVLLQIQPDDVDVHCYKGMAFYKLGMYEQAVACYDQALLFNPDSAKSLDNRGVALHQLTRHAEALASYDRAIAVKPDYFESYTNRGVLLHDMLRHEEALASFDKALEIDPGYADAHWNQSLSRLRIGDFKKGWEQYESRLRIASIAPPQRNFLQPVWLGEESISGKRLLVHADQGLGDTLQFCRYTKQLADRNATVILEVQPPLKTLLQGLSGVSQVIGIGESLPDFDMHCRLTSLPLACRTLPESIPDSIPYISAQQEYIEKWASRLGDKTGLRIGIVWAGNQNHKQGHYRSLALAKLQPLLSSPYHFVSLQKELSPADQGLLNQFNNVTHFGEELQSFSDTAGVIALLDMVISVDTSVAHLTGAMGKLLWIMLPYSPDWRWPVDSDTSPWYPTATQLRQPVVGDWDSVVNTMTAALASLETEPG